MLLDGAPFSRATVKCWLNCGCSLLHGAPALDDKDTACLETATGLHAVLAFAHAVGSPEGLLNAACGRLSDLRIQVEMPQLPRSINHLHVAEATGYGFACTDLLQLRCFGLDGASPCGPRFMSEQQKQEFLQQVAAQTAALLHIAYVLRLQPLIAVMHRFVMHNTRGEEFMLIPVLGQVFTEAVCEAGSGSGGAFDKNAFFKHAVSVDLGNVVPLFKPTDVKGRIEMTGTLQQDFGGCSAGEVVDVCVELDERDLGFFVTIKGHGELSSGMTDFPARLMLHSMNKL